MMKKEEIKTITETLTMFLLFPLLIIIIPLGVIIIFIIWIFSKKSWQESVHTLEKTMNYFKKTRIKK